MPSNTKSDNPCEHPKTQVVRVLDVILIGPLMTLGGLSLKQSNPKLGNALVLFGLATSVYNGRNYAAVRDRKRKTR